MKITKGGLIVTVLLVTGVAASLLWAKEARILFYDNVTIGGSTANCSRVNGSLQTKDTLSLVANAGQWSFILAKVFIDAPTDSVLRVSDAGMDSASIAFRAVFDNTQTTYDSTRILNIPCSALVRIPLIDSLGQKMRLAGDMISVILTCVDTADAPALIGADSAYTYPVRIAVYGAE